MAKNQKRKHRKGVPKDETPEQKTKRLAVVRMGKVIMGMKQLIQLAGKTYTLTDSQKVSILQELRKNVKAVDTAFTSGVTVQSDFELGD